MSKPRVYRGIIFATRVLRWLLWSGTALVAILSLVNLYSRLYGLSGVGMGTSAFASAELMGWFIGAFACDRIAELVERDLRDRLPIKVEQAQ